MKVMLDKPITIPATNTTKTENDDLSFLDFMPPENTPTTNETADSIKEMLPDVLEDHAHDLEQQDVAYAENAREVSDLLFQFLQKETAKEGQSAEQNKTIVMTDKNKTADLENNLVKQTLKPETTAIENDVYSNQQNKIMNTKKNADITSKPLLTPALTPDDALLTVSKSTVSTVNAKEASIDQSYQMEQLVTQTNQDALPQNNKKTIVTNKPVTIDISPSTNKAKLTSNEQALMSSSPEALNAMQLTDHKFNKTDLPANVVLTVEAKAVREPHEPSVVINQHQIRISVNPPELGPVSATIRYDQNRMVLDIAVKNTDIGEMIKQHLPELRQQLSQLNLNIDNINVQNMDSGDKDNSRGSNQPRAEVDEFVQTTQKVPEKRSKSTKNKQNTLVDTYI